VPAARPVTPEEFAGEIAMLRGRVVVLNVWATWCVPCLREIPDLLAVEKELGTKGLALLGLSVDEPQDAARVETFRLKYFAGFRSLVRTTSNMYDAVSVLDPGWNEIVPTTYLIGRDGKIFSRVQGKKTTAEFRAAALAALAAK
jgi:thiol-disulfide isomerase/thioredoxin